MTQHDQQLLTEAKQAKWFWQVPDEKEADDPEVAEQLHRMSTYLSWREEREFI